MVRLSRNRLLSFFRLEILARLILVIFVLITLRLAYLQLYKGDNYRRRVTNQSTRKVWVNATRGEILDRNGEIIAVGEGYKSKAGCLNGIDSIKRNAPDAEVVVQE